MRFRSALPWVGLYAVVAVAPLAVAMVPPRPAGREFAVEAGVALGFVAFATLALQFALTARFPRLAAPFGLDRLLHAHRVTGIAAAALVVGHILVLVTARREFLNFFNPVGGMTELTRAAALWAVSGALTLLMVLTLGRKRLQMPYQWWRLSHGVLAVFILFVATVHVFRVSHYSAEPWKMAAWALFALVAAGLLGWARIVRPLLQLRRPYEVVEVRPVGGRSWTVTLEPRGHPGMPFKAGQFAWLALDQPPYHIDTHPFSFASSATRPDRIEFTIKEFGDFTATVGALQAGATAYVEGPYGNFVLDDDDAGAVFIAGGVGITPGVSILKTMRDRDDTRPVWLLYAVRSPETVILREELDALSQVEHVRLNYVFEEPPTGWEGETGYLSSEMLERQLPPADMPGLRYFICGPRPMMDLAERLLRARGVRPEAIRMERFDIA